MMASTRRGAATTPSTRSHYVFFKLSGVPACGSSSRRAANLAHWQSAAGTAARSSRSFALRAHTREHCAASRLVARAAPEIGARTGEALSYEWTARARRRARGAFGIARRASGPRRVLKVGRDIRARSARRRNRAPKSRRPRDASRRASSATAANDGAPTAAGPPRRRPADAASATRNSRGRSRRACAAAVLVQAARWSRGRRRVREREQVDDVILSIRARASRAWPTRGRRRLARARRL